MPRIIRCHYCQGTSVMPDDLDGYRSGHPHGWYSLSVNVPPELGKSGQPFLWVGMWCGTVCLAADMPLIIEQEVLARMAYEPDPPAPPGSAQEQEMTWRAGLS